MNDSALFEQIVGKLKLKSDMTQVLVCLEDFVSTFFNPKIKERVPHIFESLPAELAQILRDAFTKEPITPENQVEIRKKVDALTTRIRACKHVEITVAFQPDTDAIAIFSEWVKKNLGNDMLIDLQYDKTIVGGALIVSGGIYKDYSVRKKLAGRFQIQRDEIMGLLT